MVFHNFVNDPRQEDSSHYLHVNFIAQGIEGEPKVCEPDKCSEWQWFNVNSLPENIFIGHQRCIPAYINDVIFNDYS
ncbi:MAG: hypothetical protein ACQESA_01400 [Patescibacteria group bacterium]